MPEQKCYFLKIYSSVHIVNYSVVTNKKKMGGQALLQASYTGVDAPNLPVFKSHLGNDLNNML